MAWRRLNSAKSCQAVLLVGHRQDLNPEGEHTPPQVLLLLPWCPSGQEMLLPEVASKRTTLLPIRTLVCPAKSLGILATDAVALVPRETIPATRELQKSPCEGERPSMASHCPASF